MFIGAFIAELLRRGGHSPHYPESLLNFLHCVTICIEADNAIHIFATQFSPARYMKDAVVGMR